jgi:hypothetical protein
MAVKFNSRWPCFCKINDDTDDDTEINAENIRPPG